MRGGVVFVAYCNRLGVASEGGEAPSFRAEGGGAVYLGLYQFNRAFGSGLRGFISGAPWFCAWRSREFTTDREKNRLGYVRAVIEI